MGQQTVRSRKTTLTAIIAGSAGNFVEWYDWFAYSAFSLYFAKRFFPEGDQTAQLLQSAAVFALGFLMRPLGAWVLGRLADTSGRRHALTLSVIGMCGGSFVIAALPDARAIGVAAPILLLLARLVQGFSLGGEYGASAAYMSEVPHARWRGFWSSFHVTSLMAGQLAAMAVLALLQALLPDTAIEAWGWRIPFVIGGCLAISVAWIRSRAVESHAPAKPARLDRSHIRPALIAFALTSAGGVAFYAYSTYMQKFLVNTTGFSRTTATGLSALSLVFFMIVQPAFGALSDKVGRRAMLSGCFGAGLLLTYPLMSGIAHASTPAEAFPLTLVLLVILSGYTSVMALFKAELFPAEVRSIGIGLPYALANVAFGGTAEAVALGLKKSGHEPLFYLYVSGIMAVALVVTLATADTARTSRIEDPA